MWNRASVILGLLLTAAPVAATAELESLETPMEGVLVRAQIVKGDGYLVVSECRECPTQRFRVDDETRAVAQGRRVPLQEVEGRRGEPVTVFYDEDSGTVNRIVW